VTLNNLTTVKHYDKLLRKVKIDQYVRKKMVAQNMEKGLKNLKRYDRRENAVCAP